MMTGQGCGGDEIPTIKSGLEKGQTLAMVLIFFVGSTVGFSVRVE